ncbi:MAG: MBL fold metallo-hydrolase [Gaiellaceae bacterium]
MRGDVTKLTVPTPFRVGPVNCYLLDGEPLTLIDTGPNDPSSLEALEAALGECSVRVEDLELIVLTHQHYDHVGLAGVLSERSGATIAAHELLAGFVADYVASMEAEDIYAAEVMELHGVEPETSDELQERSRTYRRYGSSVDVATVLHEGDSVTAGGRDLTVALRPGHSPTDTIFIDTGAWSAFVGDHLLGHISSNPVLHRPLDTEPDARQRRPALIRYLASLEDTCKLDLEELLPGHGDAISYYKDLVYDRQQHHAERKERIFEEIAAGPRTARTVSKAVWPALPTDQVYLALSEVLGHVDLLIEEERVVEEESDGLITLRALS